MHIGSLTSNLHISDAGSLRFQSNTISHSASNCFTCMKFVIVHGYRKEKLISRKAAADRRETGCQTDSPSPYGRLRLCVRLNKTEKIDKKNLTIGPRTL